MKDKKIKKTLAEQHLLCESKSITVLILDFVKFFDLDFFDEGFVDL